MTACLIDIETLENTKNVREFPNLVAALDFHLLNSGLENKT